MPALAGQAPLGRSIAGGWIIRRPRNLAPLGRLRSGEVWDNASAIPGVRRHGGHRLAGLLGLGADLGRGVVGVGRGRERAIGRARFAGVGDGRQGGQGGCGHLAAWCIHVSIPSSPVGDVVGTFASLVSARVRAVIGPRGIR